MLEEQKAVLDAIAKRMDGTIDGLQHSFVGFRTGRASVSLLDPVKAEVYNSLMPLNQLGTINTPESRMLTIQVWDVSIIKVVEKAILNAGLGLHPIVDGQIIRIPIPDLSEERRKELAKKAKEYAEQTKISIRNIRRDGIEAFRVMEKNKEISEDTLADCINKVQKITDNHIAKVDELLAKKTAEIMDT